MTIQQILYAITIAKCGSMNKAADELFISQPTLTNAMKDLEEELGITVFRRSGRGTAPTSEGEAFLTYARQLYQQYELINERYINPSGVKRRFAVSSQHYSFAVKAFVETVKQLDINKYEFAIREEKTTEVINDVAGYKSEVGVLYINNFNRKIIEKMLRENELEFHELINCNAYVYIWKNHPLAGQESISLEELKDYPCLSFEQGENSSFYFAEEILSTNEYPRTVKATDRSTVLNLMVGLNGYTLCSGIICEELNGSDYVAVPYRSDEDNPNETMTIGYISKKHIPLSELGEMYIDVLKKYLNCYK